MGFSMNVTKNIRWLIVLVCSCGVLAPNFAFAAEMIASPVGKSIDVQLQSDNSLVGQLVDHTGIAQTGVSVKIYTKSDIVAVESTDAAGMFRVQNVKPGTYFVVTADSVRTCRVWDARIAPPSSSPCMLLVSGKIVRGQLGNDSSHGVVGNILGRAASDPWIVGGLIATAIAVPLATRDNDDAS